MGLPTYYAARRFGPGAVRAARKYGPRAFKYVGRRAAAAMVSAGLQRAKRFISGRKYGSNTLTTQRDSTVTRRRFRSGAGMRAFRRKVRSALIAEQPRLMYQAVRKATINAAAGSCNYASFSLLDTNTNVDGDIWNVFKDNYTAAVVADVEDNSLYIRNANMTLEMKNTGVEEALLDVYEITAKRDISNAVAGATNISDVYVDAFSDLIDVGATADTWIGMSLYDVPEFMRQFKVTKKSTIKLEAGKSCQLSTGTRMNRHISGKRIATANVALRGVTRAYFVFARGAANGGATAAGTAAATIECSVFKTIRYAVPPTDKQSDTIGQSK